MSIKKTFLLMILFVLILVGITVILFDVNMGSLAVQGNDTSDTSTMSGSNLSNASDSVKVSEDESEITNNEAQADDTDLASTLGIDKNAWYLLLVNEENPLDEDLDIELATISDGYQVDARIYDALTAFLNAGRAEGLNLFICSAYRSVAYQTNLFDNRVTRWMNTGLDYDAAVEAAATSVAYPGTSEHHLGLALDIVCNEYTNLNSGFGDTKAGIWLKAHCAEYGFILRYPEDKTDITGYVYEPWHFRYVGVEAATYIMENDICFEEFWDLIS